MKHVSIYEDKHTGVWHLSVTLFDGRIDFTVSSKPIWGWDFLMRTWYGLVAWDRPLASRYRQLSMRYFVLLIETYRDPATTENLARTSVEIMPAPKNQPEGGLQFV